MAPRPAASSANLCEMQVLRPDPRPAESVGDGPGSCVLTNPPGDNDEGWSQGHRLREMKGPSFPGQGYQVLMQEAELRRLRVARRKLKGGIEKERRLGRKNWWLQHSHGDVKPTTGNIVHNIVITVYGVGWGLARPGGNFKYRIG